MIETIVRELQDRFDYLESQPIETIYFGGGTPSLLTEAELSQILDRIAQLYTLKSPEISLEANPDDCTDANLKIWKKVGINRLSIGLQSFKSEDLKWMNRAHTADESKASVDRVLQHGFDNITVDLMYGLPDLTRAEWKQHIQTVLDWGVPHVSSYCLTVEEKTVLHHWVNERKLKMPNEDIQSEQFEVLLEMLEENGLHQYEISNFSKPGFESKHNSNYWKGVWYLGVGPSAHSFNGTSRRWNVANNKAYLVALEGNQAYSEEEILTPNDQFNERVLTGLRTVYGVSMQQLQAIRPIPEVFETKVADFQAVDWLVKKEGILFLTREGRLRADYIASELFV